MESIRTLGGLKGQKVAPLMDILSKIGQHLSVRQSLSAKPPRRRSGRQKGPLSPPLESAKSPNGLRRELANCSVLGPKEDAKTAVTYGLFGPPLVKIGQHLTGRACLFSGSAGCLKRAESTPLRASIPPLLKSVFRPLNRYGNLTSCQKWAVGTVPAYPKVAVFCCLRLPSFKVGDIPIVSSWTSGRTAQSGPLGRSPCSEQLRQPLQTVQNPSPCGKIPSQNTAFCQKHRFSGLFRSSLLARH